MISAIRIEGYRRFQRFEMEGLGRINLLVGTNNSGKSSILEALYLLTSRAAPAAMLSVLRRRGERLAKEFQPYRKSELKHLFTGHVLRLGSQLSISALSGDAPFDRRIHISVQRGDPGGAVFGEGEEPLKVSIEGDPVPPVRLFPLDPMAWVEANPDTAEKKESPSKLVTAESLTAAQLVSEWDRIALTPEETMVLTALRVLDPSIERLAATRFDPNNSRGGFIVKLEGQSQPIPIGSLGEGIWRMLSLAIAITQCRGGFLLVDEIDTGLHYTVMGSMWKLIYSAAKEFDVQVFATTHSYDCIHALATLDENDPANPITVQRIEPTRDKAIPYNEDEIREAAMREIEVR